MISRLGLPGLFGISMGLGLGLLAQSGTTAEAFDPQQVQCYRSPAASNKTPQATAMAPADAAQVLTAVVPTGQAALTAAEQCTAHACMGAERSNLETTLKAYLTQRRRITTDLYRLQGLQGLTAATQIYGSGPGTQLPTRLATLYQAGKLDIAAYGQDKEALALILVKPAAAFRPCEALPRLTAVHGYVY